MSLSSLAMSRTPLSSLTATRSVLRGLQDLQVRTGREAWKARLDRQETPALPAQMDKTAPKDRKGLRVQKGHQDLLALMALMGHRGLLEQTAHRDSKANRGLQVRMAQRDRKDRKDLLVLPDQGSRFKAATPMTPSRHCRLRRPETCGS